MIKKLIVSHGQFGAHLVHAARRISAEALGDFQVLCLDWDISLDKAQEQVGGFLRGLEPHDEGVLILTDLFGATPSNACKPYLRSGSIEMVSGVNLPMVLSLGHVRGRAETVSELAEWVRERALKSIVHLDGPPDGNDGQGRG